MQIHMSGPASAWRSANQAAGDGDMIRIDCFAGGVHVDYTKPYVYPYGHEEEYDDLTQENIHGSN